MGINGTRRTLAQNGPYSNSRVSISISGDSATRIHSSVTSVFVSINRVLAFALTDDLDARTAFLMVKKAGSKTPAAPRRCCSTIASRSSVVLVIPEGNDEYSMFSWSMPILKMPSISASKRCIVNAKVAELLLPLLPPPPPPPILPVVAANDTSLAPVATVSAFVVLAAVVGAEAPPICCGPGEGFNDRLFAEVLKATCVAALAAVILAS
ncbi:hypothetical protein DQ04_01481130 [Trypanosoma grayi]|uniref:hypothetical protein n=1 Tax=Trypanosoma grayi TaxID=71804 RepID=UPI0004F49E77|nr:hypothetical protein DQ04_01481130 [Trypanosoma grayi]KEG12710.1 hypothetical protein DQ04_01481130 [Trypanosoma grayi]